jgi:ABC-type polar amino acid transport system ATPase subunit
MNNYISFKDVSADILNKPILKNINLTIQKGQHIGIVGPSGSGKSSLIRTINGLLPITQGQIFLDGKDIQKNDTPHIGMVFQSYDLFPHLSVLENMTLAPLLHHGDPAVLKTKAQALLEKVKLSGFEHRYPNSLSGGQQQRIAIARTLMIDPEILLLDEPTSALDPEMINEVKLVLQEIMAENITVLVVSHDISFIKKATSRILFMEDGQILSNQDTSTFFSSPDHERQKQFLSQLNH